MAAVWNYPLEMEVWRFLCIVSFSFASALRVGFWIRRCGFDVLVVYYYFFCVQMTSLQFSPCTMDARRSLLAGTNDMMRRFRRFLPNLSTALGMVFLLVKSGLERHSTQWTALFVQQRESNSLNFPLIFSQLRYQRKWERGGSRRGKILYVQNLHAEGQRDPKL